MSYPEYSSSSDLGGIANVEDIFGLDEVGYRGVNGFEVLIVIIGLIAMVVSGLVGFNIQSAVNRDLQRKHDINQVLIAINQFYINSDPIPSNRKFPSASCSSRANEVDYEFSLKQQLTGQRREVDTHAYIKLQDFPLDPWGIYSVNVSERQIPIRNCSSGGIFAQNNSKVYPDGAQSCNFRSSDQKFRNCYLYTSNPSRDQFELAYYSESRSGFVTFARSNDNQVRESFVPS
jgi:hypothetical protein